jgi:uncharacterized protein (UPF0332 family)
MKSKEKFDWQIWLDKPQEIEKSFNFYLKKELIKKEDETKFLPGSHLKKAEYNLKFINFLEDNKKFYDWIIVGCYYTIYHCALSLITKKGFSSKNHLATLCALIKFYYVPKKESNQQEAKESNPEKEKALTKEEIKLVSISSLEKQEVSYFAYAKEKRETASYGISEEFNKLEAEDLLKKTIKFLNKTREILES